MDTSPIPGGCSVAGCKSRDDLHHFPESEREKRSWSDFCQRDIANFRDTDYEAMEKLKKGSQPTQQPPGIKGKPATEKCSIEEFQRQLKRLKKEKNILLKRNRLWAKEMKEARKQMSDLRYHNELMAEERDKARKERDALQLEKRHLLKALEEERKEKEALVARKKQEGAELHVAVTESEIPDCPSMEIPTVNVLNVKKENEMSHTQNHNEEMKEVESEDTDIEPKNEEEITIKEEEIECNDPLLTFPCKFCETVYATKYDLENHIREEHERGALLSCCSCEKMFHKDIELKLHEVVQHQAKLCKKERRIVKRAQIIALRDEGLSIRAIASRMAISATTVNKWIKRHQETGLLTSLHRRPRPRVTSREEDEAIIRAVEENPYTNATRLRKTLQLNVSPETVRRRLHESGVYQLIPARKEQKANQHHTGRQCLICRHSGVRLEFHSSFADEENVQHESQGNTLEKVCKME
ncbi:uncharacterized protein LOC134772788 isoform X3 [Penaeus indicus]|uniref:uncharacterized protein LOC134772788 isoform X3 n=1 Tax=Penaeus indicus TaxID=29960 RepID=UPI00300CF9BF